MQEDYTFLHLPKDNSLLHYRAIFAYIKALFFFDTLHKGILSLSFFIPLLNYLPCPLAKSGDQFKNKKIKKDSRDT